MFHFFCLSVGKKCKCIDRSYLKNKNDVSFEDQFVLVVKISGYVEYTIITSVKQCVHVQISASCGTFNAPQICPEINDDANTRRLHANCM